MTPESHPEPQPHYCEHPPGDLRTGCPNWPACVPPMLRVRGVARPITFDTEPPDATELDALKTRFLAKRGGLYHVSTTPRQLTAALAHAPDNRRRRPVAHAVAALIALVVVLVVAVTVLAAAVWGAFKLAAAL